MKALLYAAMIAIAVLAVGCTSCSQTGTLHKPTTAGNVGTTALVAYSAASIATTRQVLKQPTCATPAVYPCVPQSVKTQVDTVDLAAYNAAVAADAAGSTQVQKDNAIEKLREMQRVGNEALTPGALTGPPKSG